MINPYCTNVCLELCITRAYSVQNANHVMQKVYIFFN